MTSELRRDLRKKTFLRGRVEFNGGASSMDCLIRDLSNTGARLELSESAALPERFDLYIPTKDETFRATLRWRRDGGVGVTFEDVKAAPLAAPMPDAAMAVLLRRMHELEAENAALRSVLAELTKSAAAAA